MNVAALLSDLRAQDIEVRADGEQLRCNAAPGALTPAVVAQLREHKAAILAFLRGADALARQQRAIVPLQPNGARVPVFAVAGHNGDVFAYRALAAHMEQDQPFFGLQPPGLDGQREPLTTIEDLAAYFAGQIVAFRPQGPCIIAGYCAGGAIAFELARHLTANGAAVQFVALFGAPFPLFFRPSRRIKWNLLHKLGRITMHRRELAARSWRGRRDYIRAALAAHRDVPAAVTDPILQLRDKVERVTLAAVQRYAPLPFDGRLCLFLPCPSWRRGGYFIDRWYRLAQRVDEYYGPEGTSTDTMLHDPAAGAFRQLFVQCTDRADADPAQSGHTLMVSPGTA